MVTKQVKAGSKETATAPTRSAESEPSLNLPGAPPPGAPRLPAARGGRHRARQGCRRRSRTLRQAVATAGGHRLLGAARGGSVRDPSATLPRPFRRRSTRRRRCRGRWRSRAGQPRRWRAASSSELAHRSRPPACSGPSCRWRKASSSSRPCPRRSCLLPSRRGCRGCSPRSTARCSRDAAEMQPRGGRGAAEVQGLVQSGVEALPFSPSAPSARPPTRAHPPPAPPSRATGKKKMSTMEKSRHDWGNFKSKQDEATRDEMDRFAKDGYLAKQARGTS